jgi:hypothetical protein
MVAFDLVKLPWQEFLLESFKVYCLLYVSPGFTFTKFTFCPHSTFMDFRKKTVIISRTVLTYWLLQQRRSVFTARYGLDVSNIIPTDLTTLKDNM